MFQSAWPIIIFILGVFLGCANIAAEGATNTPVASIADQIVSGEGFDALSTLDSNTKNELRVAIRTHMNTQPSFRGQALTALINLGDTNAMQEAADLRAKYQAVAVKIIGQTMQAKCDQPEFLPFLAREIMTDEPVEPWRLEDVGIERISVDAARIMRQILVRSTAFPDDVRRWATSLDIRNRSTIRDVMRKWWQANKEQIQKKEYDKTVVVAP
jgi:hypothetical protein